jgi:leader peptidase (prepilin peptidase) / N-methyltransferase
MDIIVTVIFFLLGCFFGSFLNVLILRLPQNETIGGRSHCFNCKHILGALDLIPLLSYVFLLGKCRYCGKKISPRYFIIEAITGILFAWAAFIIHPVNLYSFLQLLKLLLVVCVCVVTFVVDFEHFIILENVVLPAAVAMLILDLVLDLIGHHHIVSASSLLASGLLGAVAGAFPIFLLWYASKWWKGEAGVWMGFGDVELMLFLGAAVGFSLAGVVLFLGILLGGIISVFLLAFAGKNLKSHIPFGSFLAPAAIITIFYGEKLLHWYLAILGF